MLYRHLDTVTVVNRSLLEDKQPNFPSTKLPIVRGSGLLQSIVKCREVPLTAQMLSLREIIVLIPLPPPLSVRLLVLSKNLPKMKTQQEW